MEYPTKKYFMIHSHTIKCILYYSIIKKTVCKQRNSYNGSKEYQTIVLVSIILKKTYYSIIIKAKLALEIN